MRGVPEGHPRHHTEVDQAGFLRPTHQIHIQVELLLQGQQEIAAVGGFAHRTGGRSHDLLYAMAGGQITAMAQGAEGPLDRISTEIARVRIPFAQARRRLFSQHHTEAVQRWIDRGDQQMNRVGADVDRRHPTFSHRPDHGRGLDHGAGPAAGGGVTLPLKALPDRAQRGVTRETR